MSDPGLSDTLPTDTESGAAAQELSCCGKPAGRPRAADMEARMENLLHTIAFHFNLHYSVSHHLPSNL